MAMTATSIIPQTQIRFVGLSVPKVQPSIGATVGIPLESDWGPLGSELTKPEIITSFQEYLDRYGDSDTPGRTAAAQAFTGYGIPDSGGGAGGIIPLRMGSGAARATITVQNTAGAPANAFRLTAKWAGTRGNDYTVQFDADPADTTNRMRMRLRYKGALVEAPYTYPKTDIAALAAAVNARDAGNVTAESLVTGTALPVAAAAALAGGTNGSTISSSDYLAALDALEFQPFTILAPYNLTDSGTQASILSWIQEQDARNRPVVLVVGGVAGESLDDAITRTNALADPHVVNFGVGTYFDDLLGKQLSTAQLAPRIAGILAASGEERALTGAELGGLHIVGTTGLSSIDIETAITRGVTVAMRTESPDADLRIARGLTTFTSDIDTARPRRVFSEPRFIRIMDLFVRDIRLWGDRTIIGKMPNNQDTRDAVKLYASKLIDGLVRRGLILTKAMGAEADPFVDVPASTDDRIPFSFGWQFAYTTNFLTGQGQVR